MDKMVEMQSSELNAARVRQLMEKYQNLIDENATLKNNLIDAHTLISELRKNYADLMLAFNMLGVTNEERNAKKQWLTEMMRKIDQCIALIKKTSV
jgi:hypothetical protein